MSKLAWATVSILFVACGGKTTGEAVRPADPTVAHARGDEGPPAVCHEPTAEGTPLIVDWKPEERDDLESAMKQGVAVVHYDCKTLKVLQDCHPQGLYAFIGTTKRDQLISIANADEAQANLPLHGASIGAGLSRGSAIDVGLVMIGKRSTAADGLTKATLPSGCDGATHFVQSATIGAFALRTATAGDVSVKAAIDVFGASASSSSKADNAQHDGDPAVCDSADLDAPNPPQKCRAPLRVRLLAIAAGPASAAPPAGKQDDKPAEVTCPAGLVATKGVCTTPAPEKPYDCTITDEAAVCEKNCNLGSGASCEIASLFYGLGLSVPEDDAKALALSKKGCDELKNYDACGSYSAYIAKTDPAATRAYALKACNGGSTMSCNGVGLQFLRTDGNKAARNFSRACDDGYPPACMNLGNLYKDGGPGLDANPTRATEIFAKACNTRFPNPRACYEAGIGTKKTDPAQAKKFLKVACDAKPSVPQSCSELKKLH